MKRPLLIFNINKTFGFKVFDTILERIGLIINVRIFLFHRFVYSWQLPPARPAMEATPMKYPEKEVKKATTSEAKAATTSEAKATRLH